MSRVWVVNASPLILLSKIGHVALLSELSDEIIVPDVVAREVGAKPEGERVVAGLEAEVRQLREQLESSKEVGRGPKASESPSSSTGR